MSWPEPYARLVEDDKDQLDRIEEMLRHALGIPKIIVSDEAKKLNIMRFKEKDTGRQIKEINYHERWFKLGD